MSALLLSLPHVTRLAKVLVQVLELDVADQKILEESGMGARGVTSEWCSSVGVCSCFALKATVVFFLWEIKKRKLRKKKEKTVEILCLELCP